MSIVAVKKWKEMKATYDDKLSNIVGNVNVGMSNAAAYDLKQQGEIDGLGGSMKKMGEEWNTNLTNLGQQWDSNMSQLKTDMSESIETKTFKSGVVYSADGMILGASNDFMLSANDTGLNVADNIAGSNLFNLGKDGKVIANTMDVKGMLKVNRTDKDPYPKWGNGIHTWDVYANGSIGLGQNGQINSLINRDGYAKIGNRLDIRGGGGPHNPGRWDTHFNHADGRNYIRGDTELRGNNVNIGDLSVGKDLILEGTNKWIVHSPDDGRKDLFIAPWNNGKWDWSKQIQISDQGVLKAGQLRMDAGGTFFTPGRMHIHGSERLYMLNTGGAFVSKAWGGNGNLTVEGNVNVGDKLCISDVCINKDNLTKVAALP